MIVDGFILGILFTFFLSAGALYVLRNEGATPTVRRWSEYSSWFALLLACLFGAAVFQGAHSQAEGVFHFGRLQAVLIPYILLMGVLVKRFAYNYLQTDRHYAWFFLKLKLLMCALLLFVILDHAILLALTWMAAGWLMDSLISHSGMPAAKNAAKMALVRFCIGDLFLLTGMVGMVIQLKTPYISDWEAMVSTLPLNEVWLPLLLITIGTFSKTALLPFQKWLLHTLAAPTPVSAIMHAGFVNAGAIMLAKISLLLIHQPVILTLIVAAGVISALYGSIAMLVQTDVKRYLAFSTIGQMGFMMLECGMGAFHLAILHLMVHGFFKARMFLTAGNAVENRQAIRNAKKNAAPYTASPLGFFQRFKVSVAILLGTVVSCWLALQVPVVKGYIHDLPPMILIVLLLSVLYSQTVLIKTKGVNVKGLTIALLFSVVLTAFYVAYEQTATVLLPALSLIPDDGRMLITFAWLTGSLMVLGLVGWLIYLKLIPISTQFKNRFYVALLNAAGSGIRNSTFAHRAHANLSELL